MVASKLQFKQFSAHVKVDGKALECYSTWVDKRAKHVSCWIASEEGKAFSVLFEKDETKRFCGASLFMDGAKIADEIYLRDDEQSEWDFMKTSKGKGRRFKFSALNVTEEEATVDETIAGSKIMEKIGSMEVEVHMAKRDGYCSDSSSHESDEGGDSDESPRPKIPAVCSVPKSVTQGKVLHHIGFGEEEVMEDEEDPIPPSPRRGRPRRRRRKVPQYFVDETKLLAKFTFRCRPLDVLQRSGIAPRDPIPPPPDCEPVDQFVNERMLDETADEPGRASQPEEPVDEPANGIVIVHQQDEFFAEHKKLFNIKEEKKSILRENDDSDDERETFLLAELEKLRNKRLLNKEDTLEGSPRKRFKQEDQGVFISGEVIDLT